MPVKHDPYRGIWEIIKNLRKVTSEDDSWQGERWKGSNEWER